MSTRYVALEALVAPEEAEKGEELLCDTYAKPVCLCQLEKQEHNICGKASYEITKICKKKKMTRMWMIDTHTACHQKKKKIPAFNYILIIFLLKKIICNREHSFWPIIRLEQRIKAIQLLGNIGTRKFYFYIFLMSV